MSEFKEASKSFEDPASAKSEQSNLNFLAIHDASEEKTSIPESKENSSSKLETVAQNAIEPFSSFETIDFDFTDMAATDQPIPRQTSKWRAQHDELVKKAESTNPSLVFYGDSITAGMSIGNELKNTFGNSAENFGIVGDSTQHLLWRLQNGEAKFKAEPKEGVLLIGANNIGAASNADIIKGILADLREASSKMPDTKWLVLGVLPQGLKADDPRREQIRNLNLELEKQLAGKPNVTFFDVGPLMLEKDGSMSDKIWWRDGLHPRNYAPMFDAIKPILNKLAP